MSEPTQLRYPWRATARTIFQGVVGLAAVLPLLLSTSGIPATSGALAAALAISAGITRCMANPAINAMLPAWLRAEPPPF